MLISPQAHVTVINVTVQLPGIHPEAEVPEIAVFVWELAKQLRNNYPHIDVYLTGIVMFNNALPEASNKDLSTLVPAMYIVILVMLWLRGFSGTFVAFLVISFATVGAWG